MLQISINFYVSKRKILTKNNKNKYVNSLKKQPFKFFKNSLFVQNLFKNNLYKNCDHTTLYVNIFFLFLFVDAAIFFFF